MVKLLRKITLLLSVAFVIFHMWTAYFGVVPGIGQKSIHLGFVLLILFITEFCDTEKRLNKIVCALGAVFSVCGTVYITVIYDSLQSRYGRTFPADIIFGVMLVVALFIACRQKLGNSLMVVTICFMLYGYFGVYFPGFLKHAGMNLSRFINMAYLTTDGIFGTPLYSSAVYVVLFVILGAVMEETGVGPYFTDIATAAFGRFRGGPAKIAVVASGFFGSISGSVVGNVVATGTFTIPLMKKNGFEPETAGAVEAAASTGGQIMPPIMGATAFVLAENLGVPYFEVVRAAVIPALLYYIALLLSVDLNAVKHDLKGLPKEQLPDIKRLMKRAYLLIPLVFLVVCFAVFGLTVSRAGLYTIIVTLIVSMFDKESRLTPKKLLNICTAAAKAAIPVAVACGMAGLVSAVVMGTGLGFRISSALIDIAAGRMLVLLILTMIVSLIMGMGVPTTAAYLVLAVLVAPALAEMGLAPLAAHLFILYFGVISAVTPPVALAAYAGAGLAGCSPTKTGYRAFFLSISGFIIPFLFVYNPVLMMQGAWYEILWSFITAIIGCYCMAGVCEGFVFKWKVSVVVRVILLASALTLMIPGIITDLMGFVCLAVLYAGYSIRDKRASATA